MIIKRQEKDGKIQAIYSSSNVLASTYDKETKDLILVFNKGNQYKYPKVELTDYTRFELAESQGVVFNTHIKKYSFEKLNTLDPISLVEEINSIKNEERRISIEAKQKKLVGTMIKLIAESVTDKGEVVLLTHLQLNTLQTDITIYLSELNN